MKAGHLRRWGAVYLMLVLFLTSWVAHFFTQMIAFGDEARSHGEAFHMNEYLPEFFASTFENWQSEWLQLFFQAIVLLGLKHVLFKADAADMEQVQLDLTEIKEHLGIPPRDDRTRDELDQLDTIRAES
jgi:hypothetical protein